jgi:16S rRNA C967 or C1407 C5-methylase (RsmB/RsmF family)
MEKPSNLLIKLSQRLFDNSDEREQFIDALIHPQSFHPCILWCKDQPDPAPFAPETPTLWQPSFVDRLSLNAKPGQHPLHDAGYFYCLDFSSVFAASTLLAIPFNLDLILDICAAPGGKSVFAWTSLQPKLLVANEVISKRLGMLISNLKRCHIQPSFVTNQDPSSLAKILEKTGQLVLVDAPCTGQSLLAKGGKAPGCFHPSSINHCSNRQKRIIANSAQLVAPQGYLAYMTCTYSIEENEGICEWFIKKFPHFHLVEIPHLLNFQSHLTQLPCYRMWPQGRLGAGAFTALFQNSAVGAANPINLDQIQTLAKFSFY